MSHETPSLIGNFPPNTLLAVLQDLIAATTTWDIATGTFDIGSLLSLDKLWLPIKPIRILMGDETTHRTRRELLNATTKQADEGIELAKEEDDFTTMTGLEARHSMIKVVLKRGSEHLTSVIRTIASLLNLPEGEVTRLLETPWGIKRMLGKYNADKRAEERNKV